MVTLYSRHHVSIVVIIVIAFIIMNITINIIVVIIVLSIILGRTVVVLKDMVCDNMKMLLIMLLFLFIIS